MSESSHKIYTRFGDKGHTRLLSGETVRKDDLRIDTCGALDELQSQLGMARALIGEESIRSIVFAVQQELFLAGSELSSTPRALVGLGKRIGGDDVNRLERLIDQLTDRYGISSGFVIPGASPGSAALHVARSRCRRLERLVVSLDCGVGTYRELIMYLNRMSDLLFVLAWSVGVTDCIETVLHDLETQPGRIC
jgi:cob(I)alamin adenosyltransferase